MKEELWLLASIPNQKKKKKMKLFPAPTIWKQACFPDCWACLLWSAASDQREAELAPEGGGEKVSDVDSRRLCWVIWGRGWWGKLICSQAKCRKPSALPQPCPGVWGHLPCVLPPCCFTPAPTTAILLHPMHLAKASSLLRESLVLLRGEITR